MLKSKSFFGQYGQIKKIYVSKMPFRVQKSKKNMRNKNAKISCYSAYITYKSPLAASTAISALSLPSKGGYKSKSNTPNFLKASFGTNKFCLYFIDGVPCRNKKCNFVHAPVEFEDCFMKTRDVDNKRIFQSQLSWAWHCVARWIHSSGLLGQIEANDDINFEKSKHKIMAEGLPHVDLVFSYISAKMLNGDISHTLTALESINSLQISVENLVATAKKDPNRGRNNPKIRKITSLDGNFEQKFQSRSARKKLSTSLNFPSSGGLPREPAQEGDNRGARIQNKILRHKVNLSFSTESPYHGASSTIRGMNNSEMTWNLVTNYCSDVSFNHDAGNLVLNVPTSDFKSVALEIHRMALITNDLAYQPKDSPLNASHHLTEESEMSKAYTWF